MRTALTPLLLLALSLPASASLISLYQFDEAAGDVAADYVRAGASATLVNFSGSQWVAGQMGNALSFDGVNDFAWANDPVLVNSTNLSVSAWINPNSAPTWGTIAKSWGAGAFHFGFNSNSGKIGNYLNSGVGGFIQDPTSTPFALNVWHHVAFTYDGTVNQHKLYIDGSLVSTVTSGVPGSLTSDGATMGIGVKLANGTATTPATDGSQGYWNGKIDDLAMFNHTLSQTEISTIYNDGLAGISVVPEPGTATALMGACGLLALLRRRR